MLFQSPLFLGFFVVFFSCYLLLKNKIRFQNLLILVSSYIFYGAWDERFLVLIMASTATDYLCGIGASGKKIYFKELVKVSLGLMAGALLVLGPTFEDTSTYLLLVFALLVVYWLGVSFAMKLNINARKKIFLLASLILNLGLLATFKYFNFFAGSMVELLNVFGANVGFVTLNIVLPVGISFYTFQTLSYTLDIYRGRMEPTHHLIEFAAFVAFFPQLVAGPVERASNLLPQFFTKRKVTLDNFYSGLYLFCWGMFKKVYIADNLAPMVNRVFSDPSAYSSGELILGVLAFSFQIYGDFSGYSDMARGIARALGFNLMLNFNIPYASRTPSEFWNRWHISLSTWLRDYLYISLGGNRKGVIFTYRNLLLTMILGGLWHGASWTFILWGVFHGSILVLYRLANVDEFIVTMERRNIIIRKGVDVSLIAVMFVLTLYGWLIFRAGTMEVLIAYTNGISKFNGLLEGDWRAFFVLVMPLLFMQAYQLFKGHLEVFKDMHVFFRRNFVLYMVCCIVFLRPFAPQAFIYFDF